MDSAADSEEEEEAQLTHEVNHKQLLLTVRVCICTVLDSYVVLQSIPLAL